jgi:hypothetical protein
VDFSASRATGDHAQFEHHPLTAERVGALSAALAGNVPGLPAYPAYALLVEFLAYTGLRAAEVSGLEVGDLVFSPGARCAVNVRRTKGRKNGECVTGTLKSKSPAVPSRSRPGSRPSWPTTWRTTNPRRRTERAALAIPQQRRRIPREGGAVRGAAGLVAAARNGDVLRHHR